MQIRPRTGDAKTLIFKRHLSYNRTMLTRAGGQTLWDFVFSFQTQYGKRVSYEVVKISLDLFHCHTSTGGYCARVGDSAGGGAKCQPNSISYRYASCPNKYDVAS